MLLVTQTVLKVRGQSRKDVCIQMPAGSFIAGPKRGLKSPLLLLLLIRHCQEAAQGNPGAPGQETESEETESLTAGQGLSYSIQWAGCQSSTTCENKWYRDNDLGTQRACKMHHVHTHSTPVDNITDTERGKQNTHTDRRRNRSDCLTCFGLIPS